MPGLVAAAEAEVEDGEGAGAGGRRGLGGQETGGGEELFQEGEGCLVKVLDLVVVIVAPGRMSTARKDMTWVRGTHQ